MTDITTIFNKLEQEDKTFLISIYEETGDDNARFPLVFYFKMQFMILKKSLVMNLLEKVNMEV